MAKKNNDLREGEKVLINSSPYDIAHTWTIEAKVESLLSVQFTARWESNGALSFLFYNDEGDTWKRIS